MNVYNFLGDLGTYIYTNACMRKCIRINASAGMMQSTTAFLSYFAWIISKREREDWKFSFMILSLPLKKSLTL